MADLLLSWLGASMSLVRVRCVTEAQHSLLSMEVQGKERSVVGRHHQLVALVCDFAMFKAQRSFFLISKSQYAENRSHEVPVYCVTLFHLHFSITHSALPEKLHTLQDALGRRIVFICREVCSRALLK